MGRVVPATRGGTSYRVIFSVRLHGKLAAGKLLNLRVALESTRLAGTTRRTAITWTNEANFIPRSRRVVPAK